MTTVSRCDKTFHLEDLHVAIGANRGLKHLDVVRQSTGDHPILSDPGNSYFKSFSKNVDETRVCDT